jgi:hypothetical protein
MKKLLVIVFGLMLTSGLFAEIDESYLYGEWETSLLFLIREDEISTEEEQGSWTFDKDNSGFLDDINFFYEFHPAPSGETPYFAYDFFDISIECYMNVRDENTFIVYARVSGQPQALILEYKRIK